MITPSWAEDRSVQSLFCHSLQQDLQKLTSALKTHHTDTVCGYVQDGIRMFTRGWLLTCKILQDM